MTTYWRPGLLVLAWSVFIVLSYNHFVQHQNPFVGLICTVLLLLAISVQLFLLRKRGVAYMSIFLLALFLMTSILMYVDGQLFSPARRYYGRIN